MSINILFGALPQAPPLSFKERGKEITNKHLFLSFRKFFQAFPYPIKIIRKAKTKAWYS